MRITKAQADLLSTVRSGKTEFSLGIVVLRNLREKGLITYTRRIVHGRGITSYYRYTVTLTEAGKAL